MERSLMQRMVIVTRDPRTAGNPELPKLPPKRRMGKPRTNQPGEHERSRVRMIRLRILSLRFAKHLMHLAVPRVVKRNQCVRARQSARQRARHLPRKGGPHSLLESPKHPQSAGPEVPKWSRQWAVLLSIKVAALWTIPSLGRWRSPSPNVGHEGWLLPRHMSRPLLLALLVWIFKIWSDVYGVRLHISGSQGKQIWRELISHHRRLRRLPFPATTAEQGHRLVWGLRKRITQCAPAWNATISRSTSRMSWMLDWPWSVQLWPFLDLWFGTPRLVFEISDRDSDLLWLTCPNFSKHRENLGWMDWQAGFWQRWLWHVLWASADPIGRHQGDSLDCNWRLQGWERRRGRWRRLTWPPVPAVWNNICPGVFLDTGGVKQPPFHGSAVSFQQISIYLSLVLEIFIKLISMLMVGCCRKQMALLVYSSGQNLLLSGVCASSPTGLHHVWFRMMWGLMAMKCSNETFETETCGPKCERRKKCPSCLQTSFLKVWLGMCWNLFAWLFALFSQEPLSLWSWIWNIWFQSESEQFLSWGHAAWWKSVDGPGLQSVDFSVTNHVGLAKLRNQPCEPLSESTFLVFDSPFMSGMSSVSCSYDAKLVTWQLCITMHPKHLGSSGGVFRSTFGFGPFVGMKSLPNIVCHLVAMATPAETLIVYVTVYVLILSWVWKWLTPCLCKV